MWIHRKYIHFCKRFAITYNTFNSFQFMQLGQYLYRIVYIAMFMIEIT